MKVLIIGDIVGKPGRVVVSKLVPELRKEFGLCAVVGNAENVAAGSGITLALAKELQPYLDVMTLGDHVWDQKGFDKEISRISNLVRPANLKKTLPGVGYTEYLTPSGVTLAVIALQGKIFMKESAYCPFETVDDLLKSGKIKSKNIIVDFHAEATSEKIAMGYFLEGRVMAVVGTHTHVQTSDAKILASKTAYITDLGMCGPEYSVLGRNVQSVLYKFTTGLPNRLYVEENYPYRLDGVVVDFDSEGCARSIQAISRFLYPEV